MSSARDFLQGIIDYAGLFPPASLSMEESVKSYSEYRTGSDRDLLGRFIVPVSRLAELSRNLERDGNLKNGAWPVSVIAAADFAESLQRIKEFNDAHSGAAVCESIEVVVDSPGAVKRVVDGSDDGFELFLEVPLTIDPSEIIAAMAGTRAAAKVRTGGVTQEAIPGAAAVLRFLAECRRHRVPFKATAGLHHAIRSEYPLTYESAPPSGTMYGFLNVFLAAAALHAGWDEAEAIAILEETDSSAFDFDSDGAVVLGRRLHTHQLTDARKDFALSFGSCSFVEPVTEARVLGLV